VGHVLPYFGNLGPSTITQIIVNDYIKRRKKEITSPSAKAQGIRAIDLELLCLSAMLKWAAGPDVLMIPEAPHIGRLIYRRPIPQVLTREEVEAILAQMPDALRTRYLLMYRAGLRKDEIVTLEWKDINFERSEIRVTGKGDRERVIPFGNTLALVLTVLHAARKDDGLVFPSRSGHGKLTDIRKALRTAARRAGSQSL